VDWLLKLLGFSAKNRRSIAKLNKALAPKEKKATSPKAGPLPRKSGVVEIEDLPYELYEIVGESHYQPALEQVAGPKTKDGVDVACTVLLICQSDNKHDRLAVKVELDGETVGHLARDDARAFRQMLAEEGPRGVVVRAPARITGGWSRANGEGHFGISLDID
jgi:hypothetical protein